MESQFDKGPMRNADHHRKYKTQEHEVVRTIHAIKRYWKARLTRRAA